MKPLVSDIMNKASECNILFGVAIYGENKGHTTPLASVLKFFEWAYNEGKKENCNCRKSRKPTKMELATT